MTQTKIRCKGCSNYLTDPISRQLGYGPDCYEAYFGHKQPRPKRPRKRAIVQRHRGRDVVTVDLLTLAAANVDEPLQESQGTDHPTHHA